MQPIFVGDVQGCAEELEEIVAQARRAYGDRFELWQAGDLVNRGPGNLRTLEIVHELVERGRGQYVLGNHELALLATALGVRPLRELDSFVDVLDSPDLSFWVEWIRRRPLAVPGVLGEKPFVLVHAALHPDWKQGDLLEIAQQVEARLGHADLREARRLLAASREQDSERDVLERLTTCRTVLAGGGWSKAEPAVPADAWHRHWAARRHGYGVVYGHWSLQGLHVAPGLRGLDTGCVHHGRGRTGYLTAWLPERRRPDPFSLPDEGFWHVQAKRRYYSPAGGGA